MVLGGGVLQILFSDVMYSLNPDLDVIFYLKPDLDSFFWGGCYSSYLVSDVIYRN